MIGLHDWNRPVAAQLKGSRLFHMLFANSIWAPSQAADHDMLFEDFSPPHVSLFSKQVPDYSRVPQGAIGSSDSGSLRLRGITRLSTNNKPTSSFFDMH